MQLKIINLKNTVTFCYSVIASYYHSLWCKMHYMLHVVPSLVKAVRLAGRQTKIFCKFSLIKRSVAILFFLMLNLVLDKLRLLNFNSFKCFSSHMNDNSMMAF